MAGGSDKVLLDERTWEKCVPLLRFLDLNLAKLRALVASGIPRQMRAWDDPSSGSGGGTSGDSLLLIQLEMSVQIQESPPLWRYFGRQVEYDADDVLAAVDGGWASDGAILTQPVYTTGPVLATPTPGSVLRPNSADDVVLDWPDVASATNYRITVGTTLDGTDIVNAATTSSSTYTLDCSGILSEDGTIYLLLESTTDGSTWIANRYTFLGPASTRHLIRHPRGMTAQVETGAAAPGVQCNDVRISTLPSNARLVPIGGWPPVEPVPTGEAAETWAIRRNPPVVHCRRVTDADGQSVLEIVAESQVHDVPCALVAVEPEDDSIATLTSPAPGATLTGTSATFTIAGATGALEYWLSVGLGPAEPSGGLDDVSLYDDSLSTSTSQAVSDLPDKGEQLIVSVFTRFAEKPYWRRNQYLLTAVTA